MNITTIILAAGKGTRMRSDIPKILHKIADKPLLEHVYDMSRHLDNNHIKIVYGHGADLVRNDLAHLQADWIEQKEQLGTGHAVQQVANHIGDKDIVLILYGDVPLLKLATIKTLLSHASDKSLALLTVILANPKGYGRIVRDHDGYIEKIVEEKDATNDQKLIKEVNTGIMAVKGDKLKGWLANLKPNNAQGEYYLTDIIELAVYEGIKIIATHPDSEDEVVGINNRMQLSHLERIYQNDQANILMEQGVTLRDPSRFDLRGKLELFGEDIDIDINVIFEGINRIGKNVSIGANNRISNTVIGDNVQILDNCVIEDAVIGAGSVIGPFARLRPLVTLANDVKIGNFVELKKSNIAEKSKVNHLSYIGDSTVGSHVNIGAGTITCNYDGANKYQTIIEDGAFIGSDTQLIAPVTVGKGATVAAGSTVTKDCPAGELTLSRVKQVSISGWQRPVKKGQ
jgi:bifunctional UDP-N-acetylglucosamine pyrophosphorylase/glucosamine-1-phosphate N-acetyltransferase